MVAPLSFLLIIPLESTFVLNQQFNYCNLNNHIKSRPVPRKFLQNRPAASLKSVSDKCQKIRSYFPAYFDLQCHCHKNRIFRFQMSKILNLVSNSYVKKSPCLGTLIADVMSIFRIQMSLNTLFFDIYIGIVLPLFRCCFYIKKRIIAF